MDLNQYTPLTERCINVATRIVSGHQQLAFPSIPTQLRVSKMSTWTSTAPTFDISHRFVPSASWISLRRQNRPHSITSMLYNHNKLGVALITGNIIH